MDTDEWVDALVGHSLQGIGLRAVGLCELGLAQPAGPFLLDVAHAQISLGAVVRAGDVGVSGEQQRGAHVLRRAFRDVMDIGFLRLRGFQVCFVGMGGSSRSPREGMLQ